MNLDSWIKTDLFFFRCIKNTIWDSLHDTAWPFPFSSWTHAHTLTTPPPPCLWQSRHTNNLHSFLSRHLLFSLSANFSSLLPRPSPCSDPAPFFLFFIYLLTHVCYSDRDAVVGKRALAALCLTSVSCGAHRGLIVSSSLAYWECWWSWLFPGFLRIHQQKGTSFKRKSNGNYWQDTDI